VCVGNVCGVNAIVQVYAQGVRLLRGGMCMDCCCLSLFYIYLPFWEIFVVCVCIIFFISLLMLM